MDEALDEDVLVANAPTLVYYDNNKHEHHHNEGGGYRYCKDKCYIHTHCLFDFVCKIRFSLENNSLMVGKKSLKTGKSKPNRNCQAYNIMLPAYFCGIAVSIVGIKVFY